jgi:antitoxin (DNA-binding transcriptional repressor) of toxin-antitoxin stability system
MKCATNQSGRFSYWPWESSARIGPHWKQGISIMKTVDIADATASLAEYAKKVNKGLVVLTARGQPVAALVRIKNADLETVALSTNPEFLALIERSRVRALEEGTISSVEMRRRLAVPGPRRTRKE